MIEQPTYPRQRYHDRGESIYGPEFELRAADLERGSKHLLAAIWQRHQRIMLVAEAKGRLVVKP